MADVRCCRQIHYSHYYYKAFAALSWRRCCGCCCCVCVMLLLLLLRLLRLRLLRLRLLLLRMFCVCCGFPSDSGHRNCIGRAQVL